MRTIHSYIAKEILAILAMTVTVLVFVLILGNVLKQIIALLGSGQATLAVILKALGLLLPYVLAFALPIGLLTAVLLFYGRFSADQELTALRAQGVGMAPLAAPAIAIGLGLCLLCAWVNLQLGPQCRAGYKDLIRDLDPGIAQLLLVEDAFIRDIPGYWIHIGSKEGDLLQEVRVFSLDSEGRVEGDFSARSGRLEFDGAHLRIHLEEARAMHRVSDGDGSGRARWSAPATLARWSSDPIPVAGGSRSRSKPKIGNMTWSQLKEELQLRRQSLPAGAEDQELLLPVQVQMQRQIAQSLACLSFALIGIPLGIGSRRRETTVGVAWALGLVAVYYAFLIAAKSLDTRPEWHPQILVWIPNILFLALGILLLRRCGRAA